MPKRHSVAFVVPDNPYLITPKVHPPLGALYLAAVLQGKHDVEVIDLADEKTSHSALAKSMDSDYVCLTATSPQFPAAISFNANMPERCISVIGGVHITHNPFHGMVFDIVVEGEGETAIQKVISNSKTQGFYRLNEIANIDTIPFPARSLVDIHSYKYEIDDVPATTMITSRGCPYACSFCSTIWRKVRFHSAKYVLKELAEVQDKYGFDAVHFFDDVFTLKYERLKAICTGSQARKMSWRCFITGANVTEKQLAMMARSGCKEVAIGIESGSEKILETVNKVSTVKSNKAAIRAARKLGIRVKGLFIVGLPGESHETIADTEAFINDCPCDDYDFTLLSVLPNSDIYLNGDKYDITVEDDPNLSYSDMWYKGKPGEYHSNVSTSFLSASELTSIRDMLEKEFKPKEKLK